MDLSFDWVDKQAAARPEKAAIIDVVRGEQYTYRELRDEVAKYRSALSELGVQQGDRVTVLSEGRVEMVCLQFACWSVGAVFVPLNTRLSIPEIQYLIENSDPRLLIVDEAEKGKLEGLPVTDQKVRTVGIGFSAGNGELSALLADSDPNLSLNSKLSEDSPAQILYSSGTTGRPKGVVLTHGNLFYGCLNMATEGAIDAGTVTLCYMPLFHIAGINGLTNSTLFCGGTLLLMPEFNPVTTLELINDESLGVNFLFGVPTILEVLRHTPGVEATDFSRIRNCFVGAAPVSLDLMKWWIEKGVPISQAFGMTETAVATSVLSSSDAITYPWSIGNPGRFVEYKIVDLQGDVVDTDVEGELLIRGPTITPGYWRNEVATESSFSRGWLKTGDVAVRNAQGLFAIRDRIKDMYISGGENVYPAEVEGVIKELDYIVEVAVVGITDEKWGEVGCAVIVPNSPEEVTLKAIHEYCEGKLARYKWPKEVLIVGEIPHNATGKVDKNNVRKMVAVALRD